MIIYKDILTGDELFSDAFPVREIEGGFMLEVEGKIVCRTDTFDESSIGANPSAEEACEGSDANTESGCDIVLAHHLVEVSHDKKTYTGYIKDYMKALKTKLAGSDREEAFMKNAQGQVKKIMGNIKNYQFFTGSSMDPTGMVALMDYREDGITPFLIFFKDGLELEKV